MKSVSAWKAAGQDNLDNSILILEKRIYRISLRNSYIRHLGAANEMISASIIFL